jgi:exonuclease SbcC
MRLHSLELAALGPFATAQRIDFDLLAAAGLFLLDGPTGAGKSTVLDAITFALYGPGRRGGDDRLHSDFAAPRTEPFVELEFSLRGRRFRIRRTPEYERPKKRGDGVTVQPATAHLERWNADRWLSVSSNKGEIGDVLDAEIGLSREQFTQVVLLPQGEFATFLRADDDERRDVLSRLFGAELFSRITDELDAQRQAGQRAVDLAHRRVRSALAAAAEAAGLDAAARDELAELASGERDQRLLELRDQLDGVRKRTTVDAERAEYELAAARAALDVALTHAERLHRAVVLRAERDEHEGAASAIEADRRRLDDALRAEPVRALLTAVAAADATLEAARAAVVHAAEGCGARDLGNAVADAETVAEAEAECLRWVARLGQVAEREAQLPVLEGVISAAARSVAEAQRAAAGVAAQLAALPAALADVEAARVAAALQEPLQHRLSAAARASEHQTQLASFHARRTAAVAGHQAAVDTHQRLVERRLSGMAGELAAALEPGAPCPVCGAAEHPAAAATAAEPVSANQLRAAERSRTNAEAERREAESAYAELERHAAVDASLAGVESADELAAQLAEVRAVMQRAGVCDEAEASRRIEAAQTEQRELTDRRLWHTADLAARTADLAAAQDAVDQLTATVANALAESEAAPGLRVRPGDTAATRQQALQCHAEQLHELATSLRDETVAARAATTARVRADAEARSAGFVGADDAKAADAHAADAHAADAHAADAARAAILSPDQREAIFAAVQAWDRRSTELNVALRVPELAALAAATVAELHAAAAQADTEATAARRVDAAAEQRRRSADADAASGAQAQVRFAERERDLAAAVAEHDAVAGEAAPVMHLARLARGMAGQRRVALTTYVLRHWFGQVVDAANARLRAISSGRYELQRLDEGQARNERAGLTLAVLDAHTGEARSPRSLSGGETFYTSLALALGLADVVKAGAGGVDLDTLFIDEGFGSLDPETLSQVMDVIDDLRDGGRVVGVVSHVSELKERIRERLEVRRLADGSSTLQVVA